MTEKTNNILYDVKRAIHDFESKGNKREDIILKMGVQFYEKFARACQNQWNSDITGMITRFEDVTIETTFLISPDSCVIINEKAILETALKDFRIDSDG